MVNSVRFTRNLVKNAVSVFLVGSLFSVGLTREVAASSGDDVFGLELHYRDSAFQCSSNDTTQADIKIRVYDNNNVLLATLSKGDKYMSDDFDSVTDFTFVYDVYNLSCISNGSSVAAKDTILLGSDDSVPNLPGFAQQSSLEDMLVDLDDYEELFLTELGTSDISNITYDLQDAVLVVDNDPENLIVFAD